MVASHRPVTPEVIIVKAARRRSVLHISCSCVVCGAHLRDDHRAGELVCDCHPTNGYEPRHDAFLDERVLTLLYRAAGRPLNLCRALGAEATKSHHDAVQDAVARLNRSGFVRITGYRSVGHRLAASERGNGRTVGA